MASGLAIYPVQQPFKTAVRVPGSKSITNRALPMAAMGEGQSVLRGALLADDTRVMIAALGEMGFRLKVDNAERTIWVQGLGGRIPNAGALLFCGNSGTTIRFLSAMCAIGQGAFSLDGIPRMRERPIRQLVEQLSALGVQVEYVGREGYPPVLVRGPMVGGKCEFNDATSSQYISAVLMAAPYAVTDVRVNLPGAVTSEPYVDMTLRMMEQFGVETNEGPGPTSSATGTTRSILVLAGRKYQGKEYTIEPDASNASYFLAAAAVVQGASVTVEGLGSDSLQGDVKFAAVLQQMGADVLLSKNFITVTGTDQLHGIDIDMNAIPDMAQTLAVVALFALGPTVIRNVGNLRMKETDRLAALDAELKKLGAASHTTQDSITIVPPAAVKPASIKTYDDHRMAMAFAIAGLRAPGIVIEDPGCTAKTYPEFWMDLERAVRGR